MVWRMYILVSGNQIGITFIVLSLIVYINNTMVNKCEDLIFFFLRNFLYKRWWCIITICFRLVLKEELYLCQF